VCGMGVGVGAGVGPSLHKQSHRRKGVALCRACPFWALVVQAPPIYPRKASMHNSGKHSKLTLDWLYKELIYYVAPSARSSASASQFC